MDVRYKKVAFQMYARKDSLLFFCEIDIVSSCFVEALNNLQTAISVRLSAPLLVKLSLSPTLSQSFEDNKVALMANLWQIYKYLKSSSFIK